MVQTDGKEVEGGGWVQIDSPERGTVLKVGEVEGVGGGGDREREREG